MWITPGRNRSLVGMALRLAASLHASVSHGKRQTWNCDRIEQNLPEPSPHMAFEPQPVSAQADKQVQSVVPLMPGFGHMQVLFGVGSW